MTDALITIINWTENVINLWQCDGNFSTPFTEYIKARQNFELVKNPLIDKPFTFKRWILPSDTLIVAEINMLQSYENNELFLCDLLNFVNNILLTSIVPLKDLHEFTDLAYINAVGASLVKYVKSVGFNSFAAHYACSNFVKSFLSHSKNR